MAAKHRVEVIVQGGVVQAIWVSEILKANIQVTVKDYDVDGIVNDPDVTEDEEGNYCLIKTWEEPEFDTIQE